MGTGFNSLQVQGLKGFRYVMEINPSSTQGALEYKVWACVGLMDVRFMTFPDGRIYDKYLFIGQCVSNIQDLTTRTIGSGIDWDGLEKLKVKPVP